MIKSSKKEDYMFHTKHIQYPVGQGGLHLGIIGRYAYIYDCGGYGIKSKQWKNIFIDISSELSRCNVLDIFISHFHSDHYNKLSELLKNISFLSLEITIYLPYMDNISKILTICDFLSRHKMPLEKRKQFITEVVNNLDLSNHRYGEYKIEHLNPDSEYTKKYGDIILKSYTTNISQDDIENFKTNAHIAGLNLDDVSNQRQNLSLEFWEKAKKVFKKTFGKNFNPNQVMVCLYCGVTQKSCQRYFIGTSWLHTGDANMKSLADMVGFSKHFRCLLSNTDFIQIPHHGSANNHDEDFSLFFGVCHPCIFYYTCTQSRTNVKTKINDIILLPCQQVWAVTNDPLSLIKI